MSESERMVSRAQMNGSGEHPFGDGLKGVNLFCDVGHDRRFVSAVILDEATGFAVPRDAIRQTLEGSDDGDRSRWKLRCLTCNRVTAVRSETLDLIIARLVRHGVIELSLIGLDGILRRK
jgi:hypothetical protein